MKSNSEQFMGDSETGGREASEPYITVTIVDDRGMRVINDKDDIAKDYDAKIITDIYDEPVENSFKIFN